MEPPSEQQIQEALREVRRIEAQSRRLVAALLRRGLTAVFKGTGVEFDEVREYVEGDDPRLVDWNVTARQGRPFIKKYVIEREVSVFFLLDLSSSMDGGFGHWSCREAAARLCACLALAAIQNDDKAALVAYGSGPLACVPPGRGRAHVLRILRECLLAGGEGANADLDAALRMLHGALRQRGIVFILSDFLGTPPWASLASCAVRHDVIAVRLRPPEMQDPPRALMRIHDAESDRTRLVDFRDERMRARFAARASQWSAEVEDGLRRVGVDLMEVPLPRERRDEVLLDPILEFLRRREHRGVRS